MYLIGGVILIIMGLVMLINPEGFYNFTEGWKSYSYGDPSDSYIFGTRFGGVMCILVGISGVVVQFFL